MRNSLRWIVLFLLGAVVGTALDRLHVIYGVLDYPGSAPFAQRLWVPPLFGGAALLFVFGHRNFRGESRHAKAERSLLRVGLFIALFALVYFATAALHGHPLLLLIGLPLGMVPLLWGGPPRRYLHVAAIALGGTLFEIALVSIGGFRYLAPGLLPVPLWLPGLYLYAALATREIDLAFFAPAAEHERSPRAPTEGSGGASQLQTNATGRP